MGWTHATIDGLTIHELVCEVQADLIRGVNERRECLGLSPLYFWYGDGTVTKTYPTAADFDGFPLLGEDVAISEPLLDNLTAVQGFLTSTAPSWFVTTSTGDTKYTAETLATAVGLGAFPSLASGWDFRDATLWQRMQDALDLLLYVQVEPAAKSSTGYVRSGEHPTDQQTAWDNAVADTGAVTGLLEPCAAWRSQDNNVTTPPTPALGIITSPFYAEYETSKYYGTLTRERINVLVNHRGADPIIGTVAGQNVAQATTPIGFLVSSIIYTTGIFSVASDSVVTIEMPSDPVTYPTTTSYAPFVTVWPHGISLYTAWSVLSTEGSSFKKTALNLDLTAELTDQT